MDEAESRHLQDLLTTFKATCLGEGDTNAGANSLAVMTVTLANVSRTGSGIETKELGRMCLTTIKAVRRRQLKLPSWEGGFWG